MYFYMTILTRHTTHLSVVLLYTISNLAALILSWITFYRVFLLMCHAHIFFLSHSDKASLLKHSPLCRSYKSLHLINPFYYYGVGNCLWPPDFMLWMTELKEVFCVLCFFYYTDCYVTLVAGLKDTMSCSVPLRVLTSMHL